jgi:hypothetical protein
MTQRRMLALVLGAVVVFFAWTRGGELLGGRGALTGGGGSAGQRSIVGAEVEPLRIAALNRKTAVFTPGRNLFQFGAPPRQQVKPPPAPKPKPQPQPQVAQAATTPTTPPARRPPKIDFTYMGSFGPAGRKIAVFTDKETIYNAMVGEVIKDVFIVATIGFESVDIEFEGFPEAEPERLAVGGPS